MAIKSVPDKINYCVKYEVRDWEVNFLDSIKRYRARQGGLTEAQLKVLDRIYVDNVIKNSRVTKPASKPKPKTLPPLPESHSIIVNPPERPGRIYFHNKEEYQTYRLGSGLPDLDELPFDFPCFVRK